MLVLSRKKGEDIVIGTPPDQITIKIVDIRDGRVNVGIEAARTIPVYRKECLPPSSVELDIKPAKAGEPLIKTLFEDLFEDRK